MPVDNSPATNALNLLNGIDYGAVIGAPLQAAITAQAMAAKSTWEFIQEVGLQTDKNGNKSAVNATFTYQKDGELVQLIVPILTIVPIPAIVVTDIEIAFKTNINASASQSTQESETTNIGGELSGEAKVGWGAFSGSAKFKANYSSKKDSKATQDSQYSVEYTQDVTVKAAQAGMPAGLATVLNILSNAANTAPLDGKLSVSPKSITLDCDVIENKAPLSIQLTDSNGLNVKETDVKILLPGKYDEYKDFIQISQAVFGEELDSTVKTGNDGKIDLNIGFKKKLENQPPNGFLKLAISAKIDGKEQKIDLPIKVYNVPQKSEPQLNLEEQNNNTVYLTAAEEAKKDQSKTIKLKLTDSNKRPVNDTQITATLSTNDYLEIQNEQKKKTDTNGEVNFTIKVRTDFPSGYEEKIKFTGEVSGKTVKLDVTVTNKPNDSNESQNGKITGSPELNVI